MSRKPIGINQLRCNRFKEYVESKTKKVKKDDRITQKELGKKIHLSQQTISKICNGKANLTEHTASLIAEKEPSKFTFDYLMGYDQEQESFDSPLEFEKEWIQQGGSPHPLNPIVAEARISLVLEKLNEKGLLLAVNLVETLCEMEDLQKGGNNNGKA